MSSPPRNGFKFDPSETMPPFNPDTAPRLDPNIWPPDRIAKSKRNLGRGYVEVSILSLLEILDLDTVSRIVKKSYEGIAIQYGRELLKDTGIKGVQRRHSGYLHQVSCGHGRRRIRINFILSGQTCPPP